MTDFDKKLIDKANAFSRWHYREVDRLMSLAQTPEAKVHLCVIRDELRDLVKETL